MKGTRCAAGVDEQKLAALASKMALDMGPIDDGRILEALAGIQFGSLLGGSIVVESVFAWPGLGQLAYQSLFARDFNLLLGIFFLSACLVVIVNLIVDVIYVLLDPRIRLG